MKKFILILVGCCILAACTTRAPVKFILYKTRSGQVPGAKKGEISTSESYIMENYRDNSYCNRIVDSVAHALGNANSKKFSSYGLSFYKKSDITNVEHLVENPKDLDRYSYENDLVFSYYWSAGRFMSEDKYKNGKFVGNKNEVIVVPAPPLKENE